MGLVTNLQLPARVKWGNAASLPHVKQNIETSHQLSPPVAFTGRINTGCGSQPASSAGGLDATTLWSKEDSSTITNHFEKHSLCGSLVNASRHKQQKWCHLLFFILTEQSTIITALTGDWTELFGCSEDPLSCCVPTYPTYSHTLLHSELWMTPHFQHRAEPTIASHVACYTSDFSAKPLHLSLNHFWQPWEIHAANWKRSRENKLVGYRFLFSQSQLKMWQQRKALVDVRALPWQLDSKLKKCFNREINPTNDRQIKPTKSSSLMFDISNLFEKWNMAIV